MKSPYNSIEESDLLIEPEPPTREEIEEYSHDDEQDFLERELENKQ